MPLRTGRRDWLWGFALGLAIIVVAAAVFVVIRGSPIKTYATVEGVKCQSGERLDYHVHAQLSIFIEGEPVPVASRIGIRDNCLFWLHTHGEDGLIHVEAPERLEYTLGQFFAVWGQPLSADQLLDRTADASHEITATVDGSLAAGDPASIVLEDGEDIVLQYGPPFATQVSQTEE